MKKESKKIEIKKEVVVHKPNPQMRGPSKTFQQDGHWIEKPHITAILICVCGNRYLKTRALQELCLRCASVIFKRR